MTRNFYIPVSSFSFPELVSAEAISPTAGDIAGVFVGRGSYPTRTTGGIPVNPVGDLLIVYSNPVTWLYKEGSVMDYPLVIKVPDSVLDSGEMIKLPLTSLPTGVEAWAYPKTIFFPNDGSVRYMFRTDEEMLQQLQRLTSFQEVKDIQLIKDSSDSFADLRGIVHVLPDCVAEEIRVEVSRLNLTLANKAADLQLECRTGACLGYKIGFESRYVSRDSLSADSLLSSIRIKDKNAFDKASRILHSIHIMQKNLADLANDFGEVDYAPCPVLFKSYFRYNGRHCVDRWNSFEPILQKCVDFIASFPPERWNWFGNEERFAFMRDLWNDVLRPQLAGRTQDEIDAMRNEVEAICRHFKSPNALGVEPKELHSPLIQALYIVLRCSGAVKTLLSELSDAKRPEYCLALYGALKGYAYFSRLLVPERIRRVPTHVSREDILEIVRLLKGEGDPARIWNRVIQAVDKAMSLEMERQSSKAFLYILNNLIPRTDEVYKRIKLALDKDSTEYDYIGFKAHIRKVLDNVEMVTDEQKNAVMLAIELEDKRRDPVAFKYILDDCLREGGKDEAYRRLARQLVERLDLWYGGMPSDIEDIKVPEPTEERSGADGNIANVESQDIDLFGNPVVANGKHSVKSSMSSKGTAKQMTSPKGEKKRIPVGQVEEKLREGWTMGWKK